MAKKKLAQKKHSKKPSKNKPAANKAKKGPPKVAKPAKKVAMKRSGGRSDKPAAGKDKKSREPEISLGRPTITAEEKLFMLFHEDYHARQIFEFLRAETVRDLEQLTPQEIIHRLSRPLRETVDRIRKRLAERNRSLAGDEQFVIEFKRKAKGE